LSQSHTSDYRWWIYILDMLEFPPFADRPNIHHWNNNVPTDNQILKNIYPHIGLFLYPIRAFLLDKSDKHY
jgi:hypothetical protein